MTAQTAALLRPRSDEIAGDFDTMMRSANEDAARVLRTAMPARVASFDPVTQTIQAQPLIQGVMLDGTLFNLPICPDVPMVFPGGGGFGLTFPIAKGDDVLLIVADRCIDGWFESGEISAPADYRLHDLSDCFAIPMPRSKKTLIPEFNGTAPELRSDDGNTKLVLNANAPVQMICPNGLEIVGDVTITKTLTVQLAAMLMDLLTVAKTIAAQQAITSATAVSAPSISGKSMSVNGVQVDKHSHPTPEHAGESGPMQ